MTNNQFPIINKSCLSSNEQGLQEPVHFIGIGGCSMSGLTYILFKKGYKVRGSDSSESLYTKKLVSLGIEVFLSHKKENVKNAKTIVYSSAVSSDNEELLLAKQKGLEIFSRGQMLAYLMNDNSGISICGTHGKTTTSSFISFLFLRAGLEPTFIVGGNINQLDTNAHVGKNEIFIAEADESDGSFLLLSPLFEVITNIEKEHLDYYKNFENLKSAFLRHIHNIKKDGVLIAGGDDGNIKNLLAQYKKDIEAKIITYGLEPSNMIYASHISVDNGKTYFKVTFNGNELGEIKISLLGIHNVKNALACIAVGLLNGIRFEKISEILPKFQGVSRRFQIKGKYKGGLIIDDYAHHPTEIKASISMAEALKPKRKIAIFQPHRYTRTKYFARGFAEALSNVDIPILIPIYAASEKPIEGVSSLLICRELKKLGVDSLYFEDKKDVVDYLKKTIEAGDMVLTIGAGDVYKTGEMLLL